MSNKKRKQAIYVSQVDEQREPEQVRRVGRALIALARAQLEAEAAAEHAKQQVANGDNQVVTDQQPPTGDAA